MYKLVLTLFAVLVISQAVTDKVIICYYGNWAVWRPGNGRFDIENIDPFACTHLIYAFIGLNNDSTVNIIDPQNAIVNGAIRRFNDLRNVNPDLKTMIAMGGYNEKSEVYSDMVLTPETRAIFLNSVVDFMETHGFDGFDLNWEFPAQRGGRPEDKENYIKLLSEMRPVFDEKDWILTVAVAAWGESVDISYDVPQVNRYVDYINVMTYDLRGSWDGFLGHHTGLFPLESQPYSPFNVDSSIRGWIQRGASPEKIILGIGTYGRSFTLANATTNHIGAPTIGGGEPGPYTKSSGMLGYNEICVNILNAWRESWNTEQMVPYAYFYDQWVGYDNAKSVDIKVTYADLMNLGGVMVWSIETDDFRGICGTKNPLLNQIRKTMEMN